MANEERIEALKAQHAELETEIETELTRPHPDDVRVHDLKKQKLAIKDELAQLGG